MFSLRTLQPSSRRGKPSREQEEQEQEYVEHLQEAVSSEAELNARSIRRWIPRLLPIAKDLEGTVKLSRICPFCGRVPLNLRLGINDIAAAVGGENAAKLLNLTVPSSAFVREPEGNGCIERFFKTLKEQLLWVRHFRSIPELIQALREFRAL